MPSVAGVRSARVLVGVCAVLVVGVVPPAAAVGVGCAGEVAALAGEGFSGEIRGVGGEDSPAPFEVVVEPLGEETSRGVATGRIVMPGGVPEVEVRGPVRVEEGDRVGFALVGPVVELRLRASATCGEGERGGGVTGLEGEGELDLVLGGPQEEPITIPVVFAVSRTPVL